MDERDFSDARDSTLTLEFRTPAGSRTPESKSAARRGPQFI
jgi:hypothetical protein